MALFTVGMRTLVHSAENHCTLMVPTRILIWKARQKNSSPYFDFEEG